MQKSRGYRRCANPGRPGVRRQGLFSRRPCRGPVGPCDAGDPEANRHRSRARSKMCGGAAFSSRASRASTSPGSPRWSPGCRRDRRRDDQPQLRLEPAGDQRRGHEHRRRLRGRPDRRRRRAHGPCADEQGLQPLPLAVPTAQRGDHEHGPDRRVPGGQIPDSARQAG